MADQTEIAWCDSTFNPWIGCTKVSPGCDHCYAAAQDKFRSWTPEGWGGPRKRTAPSTWKHPKQWNARPFAECGSCGWRGEAEDCPGMGQLCPRCRGGVRSARRRVFCASLADVFDNQVPNEWRADLFDLIRSTPNLDWLILTKRIGNALTMLPCDFNPERYPHVWLGATVVDPNELDRDIQKLLAINARVRFLSMEPLLAAVDLSRALRPLCDQGSVPGPGGIGGVMCTACGGAGGCRGVDWIIVGGESGPGARPMSPDWARRLRDQCAAAGVPFLFKQWGEWLPMLGQVEGVGVRKKTTTPDGWVMGWAGKKAAGRLLDGREHNAFPEEQS